LRPATAQGRCHHGQLHGCAPGAGAIGAAGAVLRPPGGATVAADPGTVPAAAAPGADESLRLRRLALRAVSGAGGFSQTNQQLGLN